jgi:hypothetical protein
VMQFFWHAFELLLGMPVSRRFRIYVVSCLLKLFVAVHNSSGMPLSDRFQSSWYSVLPQVVEVNGAVSLCAVMGRMDEHEGGDMYVEVASDGADHDLYRFRSKKRSKVWDGYRPIFLNGVIQSADCHYCHTLMSCKGADGQSNGTSHLWRHQNICRAKEGLGLQQQDTDLPYGMLY